MEKVLKIKEFAVIEIVFSKKGWFTNSGYIFVDGKNFNFIGNLTYDIIRGYYKDNSYRVIFPENQMNKVEIVAQYTVKGHAEDFTNRKIFFDKDYTLLFVKPIYDVEKVKNLVKENIQLLIRLNAE